MQTRNCHPALEKAFDCFDYETAMLLARQAPLEEFLENAAAFHKLERVAAHIKEQVDTGEWDGVDA